MRVRRGAVVQLVVFALVAAAFATAVALGFNWLPHAASRQASRIFFLYWLATGISILVFSVVTSVLVYSIIHFRAAPDDHERRPADPRQHPARDRLDDRADDPRDRDRGRQRDRALAELGRRARTR